jgi:hypothetical protein
MGLDTGGVSRVRVRCQQLPRWRRHSTTLLQDMAVSDLSMTVLRYALRATSSSPLNFVLLCSFFLLYILLFSISLLFSLISPSLLFSTLSSLFSSHFYLPFSPLNSDGHRAIAAEYSCTARSYSPATVDSN